MPQAKTFTDVQEQEWTRSIGTAVVGVCIILVSLILFYFSRLWLARFPDFLFASKVVTIGAVIAGCIVLGKAGNRAVQVRKTPTVEIVCPYCDQLNRLIEQPDMNLEELDCEHCDRKIALENGAPAPVRQIECEFCHAEHRAAVTVRRFVCDRCNRVMLLEPASTAAPGKTPTAKLASDLGNGLFDVLLTGIDRRRSSDVAFKLQNLLVTNLPDARRLMETATQTTPLVVTYNVSHLKAEAIQRQLQDLNAVVTLRPSKTNSSSK